MKYLNRKILIAAVVAIIIILIIVIVIVMKQKKQTVIQSNTKLTKISQDKVLFPTFSQDGNKILFFANTKEAAFYEMDKNGGNIQQISDSMDTPDEIIWSSDTKLAILKVTYDQYIFEKYGSKFASPGTPDQTETTWLYNFGNRTLSKLNDNISNVIWTTDNKIIYQYLDIQQNINNINIANANGINPAKIVDLPSLVNYGFNLLPDNKSLVIYSIPSDVSKSIIYTLSISSKTLNKIKEIDGPTKALGISNDKIIYTTQLSNNNLKEISVINTDGSHNKDLGIKALQLTIANFDQNKIAIAASDNQKINSIIYSLNPQNNKLDKIKDLSSDNIDIQTFLNSSDSKTLYFTSDDLLYNLTLP